MGKSRKRRRSSSNESEIDSSSHKKLLKRLDKLEKFYRHTKRHERTTLSSRSRSRSTVRSPGRRMHSPTTSSSEGDYSRRPRPCSRIVVPPTSSNRQNDLDRRSHSDRSPNRNLARSPCESAQVCTDDAHSPSGVASLYNNNDALNTDDASLIKHNDVELPGDVLQILGEDPSKKDDTGSHKLHQVLASRWGHIIGHGLPKSDQMVILEQYKFPENCEYLIPPNINPEILPILSNASVNKDSCYIQFQNHLGYGLSALGKGINFVLEDIENIPQQTRDNLLTCLSDSGKILTNLFYDLTMARRSFITPLLNKNIKSLVDKCTPTELIFGSDLAEKIKLAKSLETAGKELKPTPPPAQISKYKSLKAGGRQLKGQYRPQTIQSSNRQRPARRSRETGPTKGPSSRELNKDRYRRRK